MLLFLRLFTLFIYLTFLYELIGIPVPSVASTYQLVFTKDEVFGQPNMLAKVRRWPLPLKMLLLVFPTGLMVAIYLLPLVQAVWPGATGYLHPAMMTSWQTAVLGIVLSLLGRGVGLTAAWTMHQQESAVDNHFSLETKGLFSFTRNPILLGMYLTFAGLWLLYPSWEMGVGFVLLVGNMHFRVLLEEAFLQQQFGQPYEAFVARTRRYI